MTSRLGPGGLQGELGIRPDLTTLGKYLGGGLSFGAFGGQAEIMERFDPRRADALPHAGTFNNNVLSMKAGYAGLAQAFTPEAARALNARGEALRERLNGLCRAQGAPLQFSGRGSMLAAHLTADPIHSAADVAHGDTGLQELFFFDLLAEGIWLARRGFIALSLAIGDAECDRLVAAVERFLEARREWLAGASVGR
jgi:glutamate-1-semialdehyde 2,1-aminomutase